MKYIVKKRACSQRYCQRCGGYKKWRSLIVKKRACSQRYCQRCGGYKK